MTSQTKAIVRAFLATDAAKEWLAEVKYKCPKLELGKVPLDSYNASLIKKDGWQDAIDFAAGIVKEEMRDAEFGLSPIDTVRD